MSVKGSLQLGEFHHDAYVVELLTALKTPEKRVGQKTPKAVVKNSFRFLHDLPIAKFTKYSHRFEYRIQKNKVKLQYEQSNYIQKMLKNFFYRFESVESKTNAKNYQYH